MKFVSTLTYRTDGAPKDSTAHRINFTTLFYFCKVRIGSFFVLFLPFLPRFPPPANGAANHTGNPVGATIGRPRTDRAPHGHPEGDAVPSRAPARPPAPRHHRRRKRETPQRLPLRPVFAHRRGKCLCVGDLTLPRERSAADTAPPYSGCPPGRSGARRSLSQTSPGSRS